MKQLHEQVTGEAMVADGKGEMAIDVWITTVEGRVLYHKRAPEHGKFSFQTPALPQDKHSGVDDEDDEEDYMDEAEEDTFKVCLEHQQVASRGHQMGTQRLVYFHLHHAFNAVSGGDKFASSADTDRLQATMRNMHSSLSAMVGDLSQMQRRERTLMARTQKTTARVTFFAIVSLIVIMGTSALQFKYYQGYFKRKKLC